MSTAKPPDESVQGRPVGWQDARTRWNRRYREIRENTKNDPASETPDDLLTGVDHCLVYLSQVGLLPTTGEALDIAGGSGADALYLASIGLKTTLVDISAVGLEIAADAASQRSLSLRTIELDTETQPLPSGPWDLIHISHYLHRPTITAAASLLKPGGVLVVAVATLTNLERHSRPSARFLVKNNELKALVGGLHVEFYVEAWQSNDANEAWMLARRPRQGPSWQSRAIG